MKYHSPPLVHPFVFRHAMSRKTLKPTQPLPIHDVIIEQLLIMEIILVFWSLKLYNYFFTKTSIKNLAWSTIKRFEKRIFEFFCTTMA